MEKTMQEIESEIISMVTEVAFQEGYSDAERADLYSSLSDTLTTFAIDLRAP